MVFDPSAVPDSQKLTLTLDSTPISADQTDFPLTVVLDGADPLHAAVFEELLWEPDQMSTDLWLDAADSDTITISTGVSQWNDKSGNDNHATQPTGSAQPSVSSAVLNGRDVLTFVPNEFLSCGDVLDIGTGGMSIFAVAKLPAGSGSSIISKSRAYNDYGRYSLHRNDTDLMTVLENQVDAYTAASSYSSTDFAVFGSRIERGTATSEIRTYVNGASFASQGITNESATLNNTLRLLIGAYADTSGTGQLSTHYLNGQIAEIVLIRSALSTTDRQLVEGYLAHKWGLTASLPPDHPYKTSAPTVPKRFSIQSGSTQLPVEIEHWKSNNIHENTVLLIESKNETDGATSFKDSSNSGHSISVAGNTHHETDQSKYSTSSIYFDGTGDYLSVPDSTDFDLGTGDYTIQGWFRVTNLSAANFVFFSSTTWVSVLAFAMRINADGSVLYLAGDGGPVAITTAAGVVAVNTWYHFAVVCKSGITSLYIDGVSKGTDTSVASISSTSPLYIGTQSPSTTPLFGYLQGFQIIKGAALYSTDFAPPSALESDSSNGKAVLHTKVPTYSAAADGELILSYDSSQVDNDGYVGETGSTPAQSVWDSNFAAVYHMAQDPSGGADCILDSTANANHGTPTGMVSGDLVDGLYGKALDFDRVDDIITLPDGNVILPSASNYTIEAAANLTTESSGTLIPHRLVSIDTTTLSGPFAALGVDGGKISFVTYDGSFRELGGQSYTSGEDHVSAVTKNGTTHTLFHDGAAHGTTLTETPNAIGSSPVYISYDYAGSSTNRRWLGSIREVRISTIARSADWIKLTHLSLTDALITWSAYGSAPSGDALLNYFDLLYGDLILSNTTHNDLLYAINAARANSYDLIYGIKLGQHCTLRYGNAVLKAAFVNLVYGNARIHSKAVELPYGDALSLVQPCDLVYHIREIVSNYVDETYYITDTAMMAICNELYDLMLRNPNIAHKDLIYAIMSGTTVENVSLQVVLDGVDITKHCTHVSFEYNIDQYVASAEFHTKSQTIKLGILPYVSVLIINDGDESHRFLMEQPRKMRKPGDVTYACPAASEFVILERAPFVTREFSAGQLSNLAIDFAAEYGVTLLWEVPVDAQIPAGTLYANDESPKEVLNKISSSLRAVMQPNPDGTLSIRREMKYSMSQAQVESPDYYLTDQVNFYETNETVSERDGYNSFNISDRVLPQKRSWLEEESVNSTTKWFKGFYVPFDPVPELSFHHSGGSWVSVNDYGISTEIIENEEVEIVKGEGATKYPIYSKLSHEYLQSNLGDVTFSEDGNIYTATKGQSLLNITYRTKYFKYRATDPRIERVQFWLEEEDE